MNNKALISVVMSVYNSEQFLKEAIESILNQTYKNVEFIIINDGSEDNSSEIIKSYMKNDDRIKLIDRENRGLAYSLNEGIKLAKGEYIARMDADDISVLDRFEKQIKAMNERDLDVCGGYIEEFYENGKTRIKKYPLYDNEIKFSLISLSPFAHPSVMIKKSVFDKVIYNILEASQDYDLWTQMAIHGFKMGNIQDVVLKYRIHSAQVTVQKRLKQKYITYQISKNYTDHLHSNINISDVRFHSNYKNVYSLFKNIIDIAKQQNVSDEIVIHLLRYIFRSMSPMKPTLFFSYLKATNGIKQDIKGDIFVGIQATLWIDIHSKIYNFIRTVLK